MNALAGAAFEGALPSRLSPADREQIERRVQQIGRGLLKQSLAALLNGLQGLVNWVIYILIAVLPLVLLVVVPAWLLVRRWRRNRTAAAN